jgi:hypothetical protein
MSYIKKGVNMIAVVGIVTDLLKALSYAERKPRC